MPPKNPGPMMGSRSGKLEMQNPPGTTHGGQQAPKTLRHAIAELDFRDIPLFMTPEAEDPNNWTLFLVASHHVASVNGAHTGPGNARGISRHDPKIRFAWPDIVRDLMHSVVTAPPPRIIIESREFGFVRNGDPFVAEFLHYLRLRHNDLMARRAYPAQWIQL